jgi:hypothetical protein
MFIPDPGSWLRMFFHPLIPDPGLKKLRISYPGPQHSFLSFKNAKLARKKLNYSWLKGTTLNLYEGP